MWPLIGVFFESDSDWLELPHCKGNQRKRKWKFLSFEHVFQIYICVNLRPCKYVCESSRANLSDLTVVGVSLRASTITLLCVKLLLAFSAAFACSMPWTFVLNPKHFSKCDWIWIILNCLSFSVYFLFVFVYKPVLSPLSTSIDNGFCFKVIILGAIMFFMSIYQSRIFDSVYLNYKNTA